MKYKVLSEVEVLGEVRAAGSELEIDEETAAPFLADGKLEAVIETPPAPPAEPTPPTPPSDESTAGGNTTPPSPTGEKPKDWVGNHSV